MDSCQQHNEIWSPELHVIFWAVSPVPACLPDKFHKWNFSTALFTCWFSSRPLGRVATIINLSGPLILFSLRQRWFTVSSSFQTQGMRNIFGCRHSLWCICVDTGRLWSKNTGAEWHHVQCATSSGNNATNTTPRKRCLPSSQLPNTISSPSIAKACSWLPLPQERWKWGCCSCVSVVCCH